MIKNKRGFTLVELLVGLTILILLAVAAASIFNPTALTNKGKDARRKKDLARIKVAFEEYYNDKGCYPIQTLVDELMDSDNCGSNVFSPWLNPWVCDPNNVGYKIDVENDDCPGWYKVMTNLENKEDDDIPDGWYGLSTYYRVGEGSWNTNDVNYGISSSDRSWYDLSLPPGCEDSCYVRPVGGGCQSAAVQGCVAPNCFGDHNCNSRCTLPCCGRGCSQ